MGICRSCFVGLLGLVGVVEMGIGRWGRERSRQIKG